MKNTGSADFCADQIDVITNFAAITNAVIKRVYCMKIGSNQIKCSSFKEMDIHILLSLFTDDNGAA